MKCLLTWNAGMVLRMRAAVDTMTNPIDITAITCNIHTQTGQYVVIRE